MTDVPKRRSAVALRYFSGADGESPQSQIIAQGYGDFAERIVAEAVAHDIYCHNAPELVALLMQLNPDDYLPDSLTQIIAELVLWLYDVAENHPER